MTQVQTQLKQHLDYRTDATCHNKLYSTNQLKQHSINIYPKANIWPQNKNKKLNDHLLPRILQEDTKPKESQ